MFSLLAASELGDTQHRGDYCQPLLTPALELIFSYLCVAVLLPSSPLPTPLTPSLSSRLRLICQHFRALALDALSSLALSLPHHNFAPTFPNLFLPSSLTAFGRFPPSSGPRQDAPQLQYLVVGSWSNLIFLLRFYEERFTAWGRCVPVYCLAYPLQFGWPLPARSPIAPRPSAISRPCPCPRILSRAGTQGCS